MATKQHLCRLVVACICLSALSYAAVPRFAYVANFDDNTLSIFSVNASTGQLRANGYKSTASGPRAVAVVPSGKFVYVANQNSNNISAFTANLSNGQLVSISGSPFAAGTSPRGLATDPLGKFLFAANYSSNNITSYRINSTSGALTKVGTYYTPTAPRDLLVHASGKFLYAINQSVNKVSAYIIDPYSGGLTSVAGSPFSTGSMPYALAQDALGRFVYVGNYGANTVSAYLVNSTTGRLSAIGLPIGAGSKPYSLTVVSRFLYVADSGTGRLVAFTINQTTGGLAAISGVSYGVGSYPASLVVRGDTSGKFIYVTNTASYTVSIFSINVTTGLLSSRPRGIRTRGQGISMATTAGSAPVTYVPKFLYVATGSDTCGSSITKYQITSSTGMLYSPVSYYQGYCAPAVDSDPFGAFLYSVGSTNQLNDEHLDILKINSVSGVPSFVTCGDWCAPGGYGSPAIAVDPAGKFVNFGNYEVLWGYSLNRSTGVLTQVPGSPYTAEARYSFENLRSDPLGNLIYTLGDSSALEYTFKINGVNGAHTLKSISEFTGSLGPVHPSGKFLYSTSGTAYRINPETGALTIASTSTVINSSTSMMVIEPTGRFAYVANSFPKGVWAYSIDPNNGALSLISGSPFMAGDDPQYAAVDSSGRYLYVSNPSSSHLSVLRIDPTTGRLIALTAYDPVSPGSITTTGVMQ